MEYRTAVHHAALVLDLASKSKKYMRELFEPPDVRENAVTELGTGGQQTCSLGLSDLTVV